MAEPTVVPHKIKAEWTKSSTNEVYKSASISQEISTKIQIIEQIILPSTDSAAVKPDKKKRSKAEDSKSIKCQICEKSFINSTVFQEHKATHENKFFECPERDCGKKFKRKSSLRKHSYFHKGKFKYSCEMCKEKFIDKCKYQVHLASKHNKIETVFECKTCQKTFTSADYLRKHQVTHKDEFKYHCAICNLKFKWLTSLQSHQIIHNDKQQKLQCNQCNNRFVSQRTLDRHKKIHQNFKFKCKVCNSVISSRKDNIMRHIRHLHSDIPKTEISRNIITLEETKNSEISSEKAVHEIELEDDNSNDLVIDESVREEEVDIEPPVINNRVNVIQSIGNPHKNQKSESKIETIASQIMSPQKSESEISLPPKKKAIAIARYNPIEQYRKILGLPETTPNSSPAAKGDDDCEVFPDHWRKRTSQNFLFRR